MPSSRKSFGIFFFMNLLYSSWFSLTRSARGRFLRRAAAGWGSSSASLSDDGGMPMAITSRASSRRLFAGPGTGSCWTACRPGGGGRSGGTGAAAATGSARAGGLAGACACSPSPLLSTSLRSIALISSRSCLNSS